MADTTSRVTGRHRDPARHLPRSAAARHRRAAAIGVLLVLTASCSGDDDGDSEAAGVTTTTVESTTTTIETPPQETTTTTPQPTIVDAAETARAWIAGIGGGDVDDAIALTSARALAAIGGEDGFRDEEIALAEGWGAWDFAEDLEVTAVPIDDSLSIVVLHGNVSQEGPPEESWAAIPVVATPDGDRVEPFVLLGEPTVDPPANSDVASTPTIDVDAPEGVALLAGWDALGISPVLRGDVASGTQLAPGLHAFVVVLDGRPDDRGVMARTYLYGVEG
jgi:hypothetical protein